MTDSEALPWVEKYRPRKIDDIAHQEEVVATLKKAAASGSERGDLPHLLLYGPPGTGKTSTALALVRDLFGPHNFRSRLLELNASDERGIKVVRDKIKNFANSTVARIDKTPGPDGATYPCPPFKVIILDEADAITVDAQTALRRTMEAHSRVTRFILICNYISRIIGPLTSRCAKFRFNPLPMTAMTSHLRRIADAEKVAVDDATLESLVEDSGGDLRKAITTLQSAHRMHVRDGSKLDAATIAAAACLVPTDVVTKFDVATAKTGSTNVDVRKTCDDIVNEGFSVGQLLTQYAPRMLAEDAKTGVGAMNDLQKAAVAQILAEADHRLIDGTDEKIQLYNVASRIAKVATLESDAMGLRNV